MLNKLWLSVSPRRRYQFFILIAFMIIGSLAEVVSIGAVLPFLAALASPELVFNHPYLQPFLVEIDITNPQQVVLPLTIAFCGASLIAGCTRVLLLRQSLSYAFGLGSELRTDAYRRTLHQPYSVHLERNSSEIINGISFKTSEVIFYVILPVMMLINASLMSVAIVLVLAKIVPFSVLATLALFGFFYLAMVKFLRRRLRKNSEIISTASTKGLRQLQEGLGGIRDIILDGTQDFFVASYNHSVLAHSTAQRDNNFLGQSPRFIMESAGMVLIALIAFYLTQVGVKIEEVIPIMAALAIGLQRLLPLLQQVFNSVSTIHGSEESLKEVLKLLEQPITDKTGDNIRKPLVFEREIRTRDLGFRYGENSQWVFQNLNLVIPKGACIGFVGKSGSGKSTLIDIIMGLLLPSRGELLVDGRAVNELNLDAWRSRIAHVPQDIFLTDGTLWENIAFGIPWDQIDRSMVMKAAERAQIGKTIMSWSLGYDTFVGERGVQISGGERQRIGIARALYKNADIFIFDEATSALDSATEDSVMQVIEQFDETITVLIIAHRHATLKNCDQIVEIKMNSTGIIELGFI